MTHVSSVRRYLFMKCGEITSELKRKEDFEINYYYIDDGISSYCRSAKLNLKNVSLHISVYKCLGYTRLSREK